MKAFYNKYKNTRCSCRQGHIHMSRLEAGHCDKLEMMRRGGAIRAFTVQRKYEIRIHDRHVCNHYADFEVVNADGTVEIIESKGMESDIWKLKRALMEICYPDIKYTVWKRK